MCLHVILKNKLLSNFLNQQLTTQGALTSFFQGFLPLPTIFNNSLLSSHEVGLVIIGNYLMTVISPIFYLSRTLLTGFKWAGTHRTAKVLGRHGEKAVKNLEELVLF